MVQTGSDIIDIRMFYTVLCVCVGGLEGCPFTVLFSTHCRWAREGQARVTSEALATALGLAGDGSWEGLDDSP